MFVFLQFAAKLLIISKISIMDKRDAIGRINKKRLGIAKIKSRTGSCVPRVRDSNRTVKIRKRFFVKSLSDKTFAASDIKSTIKGNNSCGILAAMLQINQTLIEFAGDRFFRNNPENSTHRDSI